MSSKYYFAHNAGSRLIGGEQFEVTEIKGGTALGVFEATTEAQQKAIDAVVADKSSAVESITQGDYELARKKKAPSLTGFQHSNFNPQHMSIKGVAAVVVEGSQADDLTEVKRLDSVEGALDSMGKVEAPPQAEEPPVGKKPKK